VADVSWLKAVRNLYGRHDKAADCGRKAIAAFRNEAHYTPKMRAARAAYTVGTCAECRQRRKLAIDHTGKPFAQILDEFIRAQRAADPLGTLAQVSSMGAIPLAWSNGAHVLADRILSQRWRDWHEANAQLVGVCRRCNSSKGSGGYRYSSFQ
jgi:5-methylcytosine-specific restriction endonuclease McrA